MHFVAHCRLRVVMLTVAVLLGSMGLVAIGPTNPAHATDGGYPWATAPAVPGILWSWGYTTCPQNAQNCMILSDTVNGTKYGEADPWGYVFRNCTSWVAWRLSGQGFNASGYGNANTWGGRAMS